MDTTKTKYSFQPMAFKNYLVERTGLPKVMLAHQQMYLESGISYVGLFGIKRRTMKSRVLVYAEMGLILDGKFQGVYQLSQIINHLNAMTQALREKKVHIAILWSMCPETYSYTSFEAYGANAMLITRKDSGNMEDMVRDYGCGMVLPSEETLIELFDDTCALKAKINDYRAQTPGGPEGYGCSCFGCCWQWFCRTRWSCCFPSKQRNSGIGWNLL